MKKVFLFIKHEFLEMLPPTIFFFIVFHVIAFARALMAERYGITVENAIAATIGALIVGKSVLISNKLSFVNWFSQKRLIYNVVWRTFLYAIVVLLFQILEELISLVSKYGAVSTASEHLIEEIKWNRFWAIHILLIMFLILYNTAVVAVEEIGRKRFLEILLSSKNN